MAGVIVPPIKSQGIKTKQVPWIDDLILTSGDKAMRSLHTQMRPSNLAESEDLNELLPLLKKAKEQPLSGTKLSKAIEYAEMVVKYVNDGSGTKDMIDRAIRQYKTDK